MTTLFHLDASVRGDSSLSRRLSRTFVDTWCAHAPRARVIRRDLAETPPPFVDQGWISASFTKAEQRTAAMREALAVSDTLITELESANVLIIGTPMFNYGMPALLKAWVDQVIRVNRTFSFDLARGDTPIEPILSGKALVILTSCGEFGFEPDGIRADMNHLDTHLRTISKYLGANHIFHINIEYQEFGDSRHQQSVDNALASLPNLVKEVALAQGLEWGITT